MPSFDFVGEPSPRLLDLTPRHPRPRPHQAHEEVHPVDPLGWVVLDPEANVLADAKAKVPRLAGVLLQELVLLDLESALEDLKGPFAVDSDVDGGFLVMTDACPSTTIIPGTC